MISFVGFIVLEDDDWIVGLVVVCVELVLEKEGFVGVWFIDGVIVEVINGYLDGLGWVEFFKVGVFGVDEGSFYFLFFYLELVLINEFIYVWNWDCLFVFWSFLELRKF